mmetsp:Transcript_13797/g.18869  ORF Transcript_13797/g.18869 Transcript_13797/m.18869 type:complete len:188 (+) Transcript_13797:44-607(+)
MKQQQKKKLQQSDTIPETNTQSSSSSILSIQRHIGIFKDQREEIFKLLKEICNIRNESTFVTQNKIESALGSSVDSSRYSMYFCQNLYELIAKVSKLRDELNLSFHACKTEINDLKSESFDSPIDIIAVSDLINDIGKQLSVDLLAIAAICNIENDTLDHDNSITLLACFKYHPYLNTVKVNTIMNF